MKTLAKWAARLYPPEWRARYGAEFEALLEDAGTRPGDLLDIARGALFMRMANLTFWKITSACALAGLLVAAIWSATVPKKYVSSAVVRISGEPASREHLRAATVAALSQSSLASIIQQQNLYSHERRMLPLADVIQVMRNRDLRFVNLDNTTYALEFANENPDAAQSTVRAITSALAGQNVIVDRASLRVRVTGPNRARVMGSGLGAGLVLGLACGGVVSIIRRKQPWSIRRIAGFAAAGMALGFTVPWLIPNEYVSTAVVRTTDRAKMESTLTQVLSDDSLAAIIREDRLFSRELKRSSMNDVVRKMRNQFIRVQTVQAGPGAEVSVLSFRYSDGLLAQTVMRDLVARLITITGAPLATEVLDAPSLPIAPVSPHRLTIALLGTVLGILLGLAASLFRRPKLATA